MDSVEFCPSMYKISTITATGSINTIVNLECLYEYVNVVPTDAEGIQYIEYGKEKCKGQPRKTKSKTKGVTKKFDNQATVVIFLNKSYANCKIFKNGCIQITGLKRIENGPLYIQYIIDTIKPIYNVDINVVNDYEKMCVDNYKVRLINTDFNVGFEIRRDNLFRYMTQNYPHIYTVYEPCIYSGVKINYYYNLSNKNDKCGSCICPTHCNGRGAGSGIGNCNKITIAVFRSGSVLVTGGSEYNQINEAYKFTCDILQKSRNEICKHVMVQPEIPKKRLSISTKKEL